MTNYLENELTLGTDRSFWIFLPLPHVTLGMSSLATFKIAECCRWKPALVATAALDMRRWRWCTSLWISLSSKISSPISSSITSSRVMTPTRCYNTMKVGIWHDSTKVSLLSKVSYPPWRTMNATPPWRHKVCEHSKCICLQYVSSKRISLSGVWNVVLINISCCFGHKVVSHWCTPWCSL